MDSLDFYWKNSSVAEVLKSTESRNVNDAINNAINQGIDENIDFNYLYSDRTKDYFQLEDGTCLSYLKEDFLDKNMSALDFYKEHQDFLQNKMVDIEAIHGVKSADKDFLNHFTEDEINNIIITSQSAWLKDDSDRSIEDYTYALTTSLTKNDLDFDKLNEMSRWDVVDYVTDYYEKSPSLDL